MKVPTVEELGQIIIGLKSSKFAFHRIEGGDGRPTKELEFYTVCVEQLSEALNDYLNKQGYGIKMPSVEEIEKIVDDCGISNSEGRVTKINKTVIAQAIVDYLTKQGYGIKLPERKEDKTKISIDKSVAKKWADEMLAQAKYARLSGASLIDLLNEIRKALSDVETLNRE